MSRSRAKPADDQDAEWLTLQQLRNLTGLSSAELTALRKRIGHVTERSDGAKKAVKQREFFRAWFSLREAVEDEHEQRRKIAQTEKAEHDAERAQIDLAKIRGELISVAEVKNIYATMAGKIREGIELVGRLSPEARQVMIDKIAEADRIFAAEQSIGGQP